jgi:hypothetical protein
VGRARLELAQGNALSLVRATSASVDKRWVEPMHVVVLIVNKESLAYCAISIGVSIYIKPKTIAT